MSTFNPADFDIACFCSNDKECYYCQEECTCGADEECTIHREVESRPHFSFQGDLDEAKNYVTPVNPDDLPF